MSSRQKRKIARQNGAKSAGAKSPAGIAQSACNATKHGLTGKAIVLSNESQANFDELHLTYVEEFRPEIGAGQNGKPQRNRAKPGKSAGMGANQRPHKQLARNHLATPTEHGPKIMQSRFQAESAA